VLGVTLVVFARSTEEKFRFVAATAAETKPNAAKTRSMRKKGIEGITLPYSQHKRAAFDLADLATSTTDKRKQDETGERRGRKAAPDVHGTQLAVLKFRDLGQTEMQRGPAGCLASDRELALNGRQAGRKQSKTRGG
jgi:hypothetical protein